MSTFINNLKDPAFAILCIIFLGWFIALIAQIIKNMVGKVVESE